MYLITTLIILAIVSAILLYYKRTRNANKKLRINDTKILQIIINTCERDNDVKEINKIKKSFSDIDRNNVNSEFMAFYVTGRAFVDAISRLDMYKSGRGLLEGKSIWTYARTGSEDIGGGKRQVMQGSIYVITYNDKKQYEELESIMQIGADNVAASWL